MTQVIQAPLKTVKVVLPVEDSRKIKTESKESPREVVKEMKILTE